MKRVTSLLDNAFYYVPGPLRPIARPFANVGQKARRALYQAAPERTVTTPSGVQLRVDYSVFVERTLADGRFESAFVDYFRDRAESWDHFVDIGANIGYFGLLHQHEHPAGRVDAFEPLPRNVGRILTNEALNEASINIHAIALWDSLGTMTLNVSDDHPSETSVSESLRSGGTVERTIMTGTAPLDTILESPPDAIKLDIEGAEVAALRGATDILASTPELLLELHPSNIETLGESMAELTDLLSDAGYMSAYHIGPDETMGIDDLADIDKEHQHFHITT